MQGIRGNSDFEARPVMAAASDEASTSPQSEEVGGRTKSRPAALTLAEGVHRRSRGYSITSPLKSTEGTRRAASINVRPR